ncbi:hypothetical protein V2J09_011232 [Rumex salicifolius]
MDRGLLLSALGVGVGVGVGLGLASGQSSVSKWVGSNTELDGVTPEQIEHELNRQMIDGRGTNVTFDQFPYYISEQTRTRLTSAAFVHLKNVDVSKFTRNLAPASRAILLSGPAELYQQTLAKALANSFEAKLLLLDFVDFSVKIQNKYGFAKKDKCLKRTISEVTLEKLSSLFGSLSTTPQKEGKKGTLRRQMSSTDLTSRSTEGVSHPPKHKRNASASFDMSSMGSLSNPPTSAPTKRNSNWAFDEKLFLQALHKVLVSVSETCPVILYVRDVERLFLQSDRLCNLFEKLLSKVTGSVLVLGSRTMDQYSDYEDVSEKLTSLFPYSIDIRPPEEEGNLVSWKNQLEEDMKVMKFQDNKNHINEVLAANDLVCDDLGSICQTDTLLLGNHIEEIVMSAVTYHLMNHKEAEYRSGKLLITSNSLSHGLRIFQEEKNGGKARLDTNVQASKDNVKAETIAAKPGPNPIAAVPEVRSEPEKAAPVTKKDNETAPATAPAAPQKEVAPDNEFEKRIRPEVIPANEIGVSFKDIGSLDETKESLQELVLLPLRRPDLFKGGLLKPCRGILLFGPPGTGKTLLAKAIASEAGASFINVSMSTITSKWFGEDEKNVRALFTLAAKVSPTIIFVDEVDSMLGQRTRAGEHEAMRKIKNEFMTHWDGLMTKPGEQILVLAATNRPFDLDDAIIRRFERRIMVGLPALDNREMILRTLLSKDRTDDLNFKELATMTEGYTGSDLKNLCITAAYRPVRDLIQKERKKTMEKKRKSQEGQNKSKLESKKAEKEDEVITLRALNMEDMKWAKSQFCSRGSGHERAQAMERALRRRRDKEKGTAILLPIDSENRVIIYLKTMPIQSSQMVTFIRLIHINRPSLRLNPILWALLALLVGWLCN